jgi:hypothetical protein
MDNTPIQFSPSEWLILEQIETEFYTSHSGFALAG